MWTFFVNGERATVDPARWGPETTLLEYLRKGLSLTGAKLGCGEGGCGACTVMVSSIDVSSGELVHRSVNACLAPLCSVESMLVTTVEGIGSERSSAPHPVQERIAKFHGSQCGFCTPGIVMSLYTALRNESRPTMAALEEVFDGNLCRCTGYRPIIDAARSFATDRASCPCSSEASTGGAGVAPEVALALIAGDGDQGPSVALSGGKVVVSSSRTKAAAALGSALGAPEGTIERCSQIFDPDAAAPPFPDELARSSGLHLRVAGARVTWERPTSELALLRLLAAEPSARIVAGNTEVGIETKFKHVACPLMVSTGAIASMHLIAIDATRITIGGAVTLAALERFLHAEITATAVPVAPRRPTGSDAAPAKSSPAAAAQDDGGAVEPHFSMRGALAMCNMLRWFASTQIRNVATLAGNIATASPISDMNPVLVALNAEVVLATIDGDDTIAERRVSMHDFFLGYRKTAMAPHEAILRITVPLTTRFEFVQSYKQARRRDDDISITTACMRIKLEVAPPPEASGGSRASGASSAPPSEWRVHSASLAFGGMGPTTFTATAAEEALAGQLWTRELWSAACAELQRSVALPPDVIGGMAAFRSTLAVSFLHKFCIATNTGLATAHESVRVEREQLGLLAHAGSDPNALAVPAPVLLDARERSASTNFLVAPRPATFGEQSYPMLQAGGLQHGGARGGGTVDHAPVDGANAFAAQADPSLLAPRAPVGQPLPHRSAVKQCTGEAVYVDDMPDPSARTMHAALVLARQAHARIVSIDASLACAMGDDVHFFSAADLTDDANTMGAVLLDEQLFRKSTVTSAGQPLGVIVAPTESLAKRAARAVVVDLEPLPSVVSIEAARAKGRFHPVRHEINCGNAAFATSELERRSAPPGADPSPPAVKGGDGGAESGGAPPVPRGSAAAHMDAAFAYYAEQGDATVAVVSGDVRIGGQEHFYLECNCAIAVPGEGDEMVIFASTQNPTKTQKFAARACGGISASRVVCRVKRMGGGFGGKETRSVFVSSAAALCAHRLNRPVRLNLDRDVDMWTTGTRHPFLARYRVAADRATGKLLSVDVSLWSNAGYSLDLSEAVMDRALFHSDNAYYVPHMRAVGDVCLTNSVTNTAFRGFGGPQGMIVAEAWLEHLASHLGRSAESLRCANMYVGGERTPYGQIIGNCPLRRLWSELDVSVGGIEARRAACDVFNAENRWRKRGVAALPTKFGINFTAKFMNQAGALVNVYTDGTVLVTHGGTEMGQGLHTKIEQIAARAFRIPFDAVFVAETATDKVPNSSPTAASASSDLYGMAVLNACEQIIARLEPIRAKLASDASFHDIVNAAYFERINLSAQGFYKIADDRCGYMWDHLLEPAEEYTGDVLNDQRGMPFNYFTNGVAYCEVEIDVLTGDARTLRTDIVMDVGASINPAIDIGQIEGAFVQGFGWAMLEELVWGSEDGHAWLPPGHCMTRGPGTYKIPSFNDVPVEMNVTLLKDHGNPSAVHSSKAIGEPPFFLGATALFAARQAIAAARCDARSEDPSAAATLDLHWQLELPLTPERIRMACGDRYARSAIAHQVKSMHRDGAAPLEPAASISAARAWRPNGFF